MPRYPKAKRPVPRPTLTGWTRVSAFVPASRRKPATPARATGTAFAHGNTLGATLPHYLESAPNERRRPKGEPNFSWDLHPSLDRQPLGQALPRPAQTHVHGGRVDR